LFKAQNLAVPFSGDYFKPIWKSGSEKNDSIEALLRMSTISNYEARQTIMNSDKPTLVAE